MIKTVDHAGAEGLVHIENLVKRYGSFVALDHLNLDVKEGDQLYAGSSEI